MVLNNRRSRVCWLPVDVRVQLRNNAKRATAVLQHVSDALAGSARPGPPTRWIGLPRRQVTYECFQRVAFLGICRAESI